MFRWFWKKFSWASNHTPHIPPSNVKIELYKTDWCPHCRTAARIISKFNARNIYIYDVEKQPEKGQEMLLRTGGQKSIPQIFIDGVHVGNCAHLINAVKTGYIRDLLKLNVIDIK